MKSRKTSWEVGSLSVEAVRRMAAAVLTLPVKPLRPGDLLSAAVRRLEMGSKLLRDQSRASRKASSSSTRPAGPVAHQVRGVAPEANPWDAMRRKVRGWLELLDMGEAEDRAILVWSASQKCWSLAELRSVLPELRAAVLPDPLEAEAAMRGRSPLR